MSTQIQFLRTDQAQLRPDPNVLANGMPLLNFNEQEPGLFFKARDGSLFKVGPTAVGELAPNSGANGFAGNVKGETWLDTSGLVPMLKVYDGVQWVPSSDPGGVSSVALSMPGALFDVAGSPITSAGVLDVSLQPQVRNRVLAGPIDGSAQQPTFRALGSDDIPGLDGSKIVAGFVNQARIPSLDATKITSGVFNSARIPGIDATKIVSGVLPYQFGGTGVSAFPQNGEILIGGLSNGWRKNTIQAGSGVLVTNGPGTIQLSVQPPGVGGEVLFNNGGVLGADNAFTFDGSTNRLDLIGTLDVDGVIEVSGGPGTIRFTGGSGYSVSLVEPPVLAQNLTLKLPGSNPVTSAQNLIRVEPDGQLTITDTIGLNNLTVRDSLQVENSFTGFSTSVRAGTGLSSNLDLFLPASYGSGGFIKTDSAGTLAVESNVSAPIVSTPEIIQSDGSPLRSFHSGVGTLTVSSDGTYTLVDILNVGSPVSVNFTVFVHDETATVGTGSLTQTFNAHFNGSTAVLSAGSDKVDSWSASTEPTFSVDTSGPAFRIRTTTASGSNQLVFMVHYTYVINVTPTP